MPPECIPMTIRPIIIRGYAFTYLLPVINTAAITALRLLKSIAPLRPIRSANQPDAKPPNIPPTENIPTVIALKVASHFFLMICYNFEIPTINNFEKKVRKIR